MCNEFTLFSDFFFALILPSAVLPFSAILTVTKEHYTSPQTRCSITGNPAQQSEVTFRCAFSPRPSSVPENEIRLMIIKGRRASIGPLFFQTLSHLSPNHFYRISTLYHHLIFHLIYGSSVRWSILRSSLVVTPALADGMP